LLLLLLGPDGKKNEAASRLEELRPENSRSTSGGAVEGRALNRWLQSLEILRIEGAERRFNSGAEPRYSIMHALAQERDPSTGADEKLRHSHG
jgi:hypothetical protein